MEHVLDNKKLTELFKAVIEGDEADEVSAGSQLTEFGANIIPNILEFAYQYKAEPEKAVRLIRIASAIEGDIPQSILRKLESDDREERHIFRTWISLLGDKAVRALVKYAALPPRNETGLINAIIALRLCLQNTIQGISEPKEDDELVELYDTVQISKSWLGWFTDQLSEISIYLIWGLFHEEGNKDVARHMIMLSAMLGKFGAKLIVKVTNAEDEKDAAARIMHVMIKQLKDPSTGDLIEPDKFIEQSGGGLLGYYGLMLIWGLLTILYESPDFRPLENDPLVDILKRADGPRMPPEIKSILFEDNDRDFMWRSSMLHYKIAESIAAGNLRLLEWLGFISFDIEEEPHLMFYAAMCQTMGGYFEPAIALLKSKSGDLEAKSSQASLIKLIAYQALALGVQKKPHEVIKNSRVITNNEAANLLIDYADADFAKNNFGETELVFPLYALSFCDRSDIRGFLWKVVHDKNELLSRRLQALFALTKANHGCKTVYEPQIGEVKLKEEIKLAQLKLPGKALGKLLVNLIDNEIWQYFANEADFTSFLLAAALSLKDKELLGALHKVVPTSLGNINSFDMLDKAIQLLLDKNMHEEAELLSRAGLDLVERAYEQFEIDELVGYTDEPPMLTDYECRLKYYLAKGLSGQGKFNEALKSMKMPYGIERKDPDYAYLYGMLDGIANGEAAITRAFGVSLKNVKDDHISEHLYIAQSFPIAYSVRKIRGTDYTAEFFSRIEHIVKFFAILLLADRLSYTDKLQAKVTQLISSRLVKPYFGHWREVVSVLSSNLVSEGESGNHPILFELASAISSSEISGWLSTINEKRNKSTHGTPESKNIQLKSLQDNLRTLRSLLESVRTLAKGQLVYIDAFKAPRSRDINDGGIYTGLSLNGFSPEFELIKEINIDKAVAPGRIYFLTSSQSVIPMDPFLKLKVCECGMERLYIFNKVNLEKRAVLYHNLTCQCEEESEEGFDELIYLGFDEDIMQKRST